MRTLPQLPHRAPAFALAVIASAVATAQPPAANPRPVAIQVPAGFEVIPVALPPLVTFPMLGNFDERGRLFVAENAGVNLDEKELDAKRPSCITMLEDTDGDGIFDRSTVFADQLAFPMGAVWHEGALFVTSAPGLWRLEDRDGDGRADSRALVATGFKSNGNAADVHGPFLHPNGRLYWCHGRKGHEVYQNGGGALVSKGLGARIWSCRPDGSDIQVYAGGGMDNPVELAFNQEGEMFGTVNIFQGSPRSDAILHWVHGGVYPRTDQEPVIAEFKRTGDLLPPVAFIGHVAPAGIALPRSEAWGADYRNNLLYAEFNTHRIMRVPLERTGATYRGAAQVFATAADSGVHFTDVIEDADGSLLVIDTGAWFRRGCPTSVVSRPDITGGIYRIRRIGARGPADPRGNAIAWTASSPEALTALLGDPRYVVRDRAVAELVKRGAAAVPALTTALENTHYLVRSNAVWALTRIGSPAAQSAARRALPDHDARIREVACQSAFITSDSHAAEALIARLGDDSPSVQREAARALGRLRNPKAIPALGAAAAIPHDPILTHALIYALIEIDSPAETQALLNHREPLARRAAMIALDASAGEKLGAAPVFAALRDQEPALRSAALKIAVRHPEWGRAAADYLATAVAGTLEPAAKEVVARLVAAFLSAQEVRDWLRASPAPALDPVLLLDAIAGAPNAWDESWRELLASSLRSPDTHRAQAALRAIATHRQRGFSALLQDVGRDTSRPAAMRVAALRLATGVGTEMDAGSFDLLLGPFVVGGTPDARLQAATVLAEAKLNRAQLLKLTDVMPGAGPVELQQLLDAFQRGPADAETAARLLGQLTKSPGRWGVRPQTLQAVFLRFPPPAHENAGPLIAEIMNQNAAKDARVTELETLAGGGDPARGRAAFFAGTGACLTCHRVGDTGGVLGPDLSHIGRIRTSRDLLEAISFPSATIARGYEAFQVTTRDGNSLLGTIPRETSDTVFLLTADGRENPVPRATITKQEPIAMSLMPPGLDRAVEPKVLADLVAFLRSLQ
ncbi:MAG: HEAT repeat domain-containing protein [Verrucomicrobia bacterium]|nr:HEAT repeat domain-containing protein [Verrucomicrobiota bacterium]